MKYWLIILFMLMRVGVNAQDLIVPKTGEPIKAYNLEVSDRYYFYTLTPQSDGRIFKIEKDKVLIIRKADGATLNETTPTLEEERQKEDDYPIINESDIHGNLIAKGNCVYIPTNGPTDYEKAGQEIVKKRVSSWNFWTVVNKPEQAHFILQYVTETSGPDKSFLLIRPRKYYREYPSPSSFYHSWSAYYDKDEKSRAGISVVGAVSDEDLTNNRQLAAFFCDRYFYQVVTRSDVKHSAKWFKHNAKALDADSGNNNAHWVRFFD